MVHQRAKLLFSEPRQAPVPQHASAVGLAVVPKATSAPATCHRFHLLLVGIWHMVGDLIGMIFLMLNQCPRRSEKCHARDELVARYVLEMTRTGVICMKATKGAESAVVEARPPGRRPGILLSRGSRQPRVPWQQ